MDNLLDANQSIAASPCPARRRSSGWNGGWPAGAEATVHGAVYRREEHDSTQQEVNRMLAHVAFWWKAKQAMGKLILFIVCYPLSNFFLKYGSAPTELLAI
jgi:hypothetical protein